MALVQTILNTYYEALHYVFFFTVHFYVYCFIVSVPNLVSTLNETWAAPLTLLMEPSSLKYGSAGNFCSLCGDSHFRLP